VEIHRKHGIQDSQFCSRFGRISGFAAAQKAAEHIGSVHHEVNFTVQEGLDAVRDVIYHLETYDVTT
jgi:asparagine synthetase B (glutamine-hydrolysing)